MPSQRRDLPSPGPGPGPSLGAIPAVDARLEAVVIGVVQGVGFRWFALEAAGRLGLRGWVANRADGAVICVAEGPRPVLEALLRELARGPISADVERVIPAWMPATGRLGRFRDPVREPPRRLTERARRATRTFG